MALFFAIFIASATARADGSSHTITVTVPEICRYRVESVDLIQTTPEFRLYEVRLAVFNNTSRSWRLLGEAPTDAGVLEWSVDGRNWHGASRGWNDLFQGARVNWASYRVWYRYYPLTADSGNSFQLQYQLSYQN
jgi:hypothetical protein